MILLHPNPFVDHESPLPYRSMVDSQTDRHKYTCSLFENATRKQWTIIVKRINTSSDFLLQCTKNLHLWCFSIILPSNPTHNLPLLLQHNPCPKKEMIMRS